jgi:hypothetical protein
MSSHRLNDILGMRIRFADGRDGDRVLDLRLTPSARISGPLAELVTEGVIAGKARPGTLFGYDRNREQGPWPIRTIIRALHRHTGYVTWDDVDHIDWNTRVLHLRVNQLAELT